MRKISLYIIMVMSVVASCRKYDDHVFNKSPEERINEVLGAAQSAIVGATDGWKANILTGDSSYFSFYFRFNNDNRVFMMSDYSEQTASVIRESSYRLKALQQATLIFDTYSYIHILSDPDGRVNGGQFGIGRIADFEFAIDTVTADSIHLTGRFNHTVVTLKKATAQDRAAWESKQVAASITKLRNISNIQQYFKRLYYNSKEYEVLVDTFAKRVQFTWKEGAAQSVTRGYYVTTTGVQFTDPVVGAGNTIPGFSVVSFDAGNSQLNITINGTAAAIKGVNDPMNPDLTAFNRWKNRVLPLDSYWITIDGFHINGVDNANNITSLATDSSTYLYTLYWPEFGGNFDLFTPILLHTAKQQAQIVYGLGFRGTDIGGGKTNFTDLGALQGGSLKPYPTTGVAAQMRQTYDNNGPWWFIQTSADSYDMVSAKDARIWLSWFYVF